jgi:putative transcriptional regulator
MLRPELNVRGIRERQHMTQVQFSEKFGLNLWTLRDWENKRYQPTGPARVLLIVIDRAPAAVISALEPLPEVAKIA